jgi:MFS family permease
MMITLMLLSGISGSTALSNVAGTITDLFGDADNAGQPMALFVMSANTGPSIGSVIGEWIVDNPHMGLNWVFWIK